MEQLSGLRRSDPPPCMGFTVSSVTSSVRTRSAGRDWERPRCSLGGTRPLHLVSGSHVLTNCPAEKELSDISRLAGPMVPTPRPGLGENNRKLQRPGSRRQHQAPLTQARKPLLSNVNFWVGH